MKSLSAIKDHRLIQFAREYAKLTAYYVASLFVASVLGGWLSQTILVSLKDTAIENTPFQDISSFLLGAFAYSISIVPFYLVLTWPAIILVYVTFIVLYHYKLKLSVGWIFLAFLIFALYGFWAEFSAGKTLFSHYTKTLAYHFAPSLLLGFFMHSLTYAEDNNFIFRAKLFLIPAVLIFGINMALFFTL